MTADGIGVEATIARVMSKMYSRLGMHAYARLAQHLWGTCGFRHPPLVLDRAPVELLLGNAQPALGEAGLTAAYR